MELAARDTAANLNEAFRRSLPNAPPLRIRVVGVEEVPNSVTSTIAQMKNSAPITRLRAARKADLVIVFHHHNLSYAGKAFIYCG